MSYLVLVLGDQLSHGLSALSASDPTSDIVVMAEVSDETTYVPHHPKKIAFVLAAMRAFAQELRDAGWQVRYTRLDDPENSHSIPGELLRAAAETGATAVRYTEPGEWRLIDALADTPLTMERFEDDRFVASHAVFEDWAEGRKELRMEYFYRQMRRETGLLMDGDAPVEGKWNFDHDNRKPAGADMFKAPPKRFAVSAETEAVLDLVEVRHGDNFGVLRPFELAVDRAGALEALDDFIENRLALFGDYQDAMLEADPFLYHAHLSLYLNVGLLDPIEVCKASEAAYRDGRAPINAVEGFIRQIIGWREYVRGIYFFEGREYVRRNTLGHTRELPSFFWSADTDMNCIAHAVGQTRDHAYAHHIQRLMVTGNFALLAGIDPFQVHEWYLAVYFDAFEWVEAPNVIGMSQHADGGVLGSKPYVSSGNYIDRMSDYCGSCAYNVKDKVGETACPFNLLYWDFLLRHEDRFKGNPRMGNMYRTWGRMGDDRKEAVLSGAKAFLEKLDRGDRV